MSDEGYNIFFLAGSHSCLISKKMGCCSVLVVVVVVVRSVMVFNCSGSNVVGGWMVYG